jgi:hypothetical protein
MSFEQPSPDEPPSPPPPPAEPLLAAEPPPPAEPELAAAELLLEAELEGEPPVPLELATVEEAPAPPAPPALSDPSEGELEHEARAARSRLPRSTWRIMDQRPFQVRITYLDRGEFQRMAGLILVETKTRQLRKLRQEGNGVS